MPLHKVMAFLLIVLSIIGLAALALSVQAVIETHTLLFRTFVVCALLLLLVAMAPW